MILGEVIAIGKEATPVRINHASSAVVDIKGNKPRDVFLVMSSKIG